MPKRRMPCRVATMLREYMLEVACKQIDGNLDGVDALIIKGAFEVCEKIAANKTEREQIVAALDSWERGAFYDAIRSDMARGYRRSARNS